MTKRKRNVFTVIESIDNWFEAGKCSTDPTADHEGVFGVPNCVTNLGTSITVNRQVVEDPNLVSDPEQWVEVGHESPSCLPISVQVEVQSKLAKGAASWTANGPRLPTGTEGGTKDEEGPASKGELGNANLDTRWVLPLGTEGVNDADLAIITFWRVLKEAGYDVWFTILADG